MTTDEARSPDCARVLDGLVEGRDVSGDRELGEHMRSCMSCFRSFTELRDAPRLAALLRADPVPSLQGERFWDQLAERTTAAAASALRAPDAAPVRNRFSSTRFRSSVFGAAAAVAAAVALLVVVRGSPPVAPALPGERAVVSATAVQGLPEADEGELEVADLDGVALRRLADRLRAGAPGGLSGSMVVAGATDATDGSEGLFDDAQVHDELAELDSSALLRLERSLAGAAL